MISKWISAEILMKMTIVLCFSQQRLIVLFHTFFGDDAAEMPVLFHPLARISLRTVKPNEVAEPFCSVFIVIIEHGINRVFVVFGQCIRIACTVRKRYKQLMPYAVK